MRTLRVLATATAVLGTGALVGASLYDAVVLAPNLQQGPEALEHGRLFMTAATPANLFRVLSPLTQILLLLALVANWKDRACRWALIAGLGALVATDALTFAFHYPRLRLMFTSPLSEAPDAVARAAREWAGANLVRVALVLASWSGATYSLFRIAPADRGAAGA
ncbi:MAG: hypothetical protein U0P81_14630 [Holophagaceae bacterium]